MELKSIGHLPPQPNWMMKNHVHTDHNELIIPLRGRMHLSYGTTQTVVGAGDVMLYPAGCWHEERSDDRDPVELAFFAFAEDMGTAIRVVPDPERKIRRLAGYLIEARQRLSAPGVLTAYAGLIVDEFRFLAANDTQDTLVTACRAFMRQSLATPLTVDDLAAHAGLSRFHFIRTYRRLTGTTPMADFRRLRIEEAANLLELTNLPLKAIAPMTGFANEYHFSRIFRKIMGTTPGRYKAKGKNRMPAAPAVNRSGL